MGVGRVISSVVGGLVEFVGELPKKKLPRDIKKRLDDLVYACNLKSSQENVGKLGRELKSLLNYRIADYVRLLMHY